MTACKFSLGEIVWCKSPATLNVWPAKIDLDKASGQWFKDKKVFLVFYGQVKCQTGRWMALANVVPFQDVAEKDRTGPAAFAAAYKQAKDDFDKRSEKLTSEKSQGKASKSGKDTKSKEEQDKTPKVVQNTKKDVAAKGCADSTPQRKEQTLKNQRNDAESVASSSSSKDIKSGAAEKAVKAIPKRNHPNADELTPKSKKSRAESTGLRVLDDLDLSMSFGSSFKTASSGFQESAGNNGSGSGLNKSKKSQKKADQGLESGSNKENRKPVKTIIKAKNKSDNLKETLTSLIDKEFGKRSGGKQSILDESGETPDDSSSVCHQCWQSSEDPKSICTSKICPGNRGQFCKTCLKNFYDEDIETVLKSPDWKCPPCRGCCKCSTCKNLQQKHPNGILSQLALNRGHQTVRSYLETIMKNIGK